MAITSGTTCCLCADSAGIPQSLTVTLNAPFCGTAVHDLQWQDSSSTLWNYLTALSIPVGDYVAGSSSCFTDGTNNYVWAYAFPGGFAALFLFVWTPPSCFNFSGSSTSAKSSDLTASVCTPTFSATYNVTGTNLPDPSAAGVTSLTITGCPGGACCCQFLTEVVGCNSTVLPNATVNWWTSSAKTSLISTGTTDSTGDINGCVGSAGTYWREIVATRFTTLAGNVAATCSGSETQTLSAGSGFTCMGGSCPYPLADTLHCTFANAGLQTFTFSGSLWTASFTYLSVAYVISINAAQAVTATAGGTGFTASFAITTCPVDPGFTGTMTVPGTGPGSALGNGVITE
jgi:hypothetical protein